MESEEWEIRLATRARIGDSEALAELVERLRTPLFAICYSELRHYEDAQDAVASALGQICLSLPTLRDPQAARAWMNRIARNEARQLRRHAHYALALETAEVGSDTAPSSLLRLDIEAALRRVPQEQARALALYHLAELSIAEIALRVARPEGTIKRWLYEGRRRLAQELKGYAPMTNQPTAAIVSSELDAETLDMLENALRAAGYGQVNRIRDLTALAYLDESGEGDNREFHLPTPLRGTQFIVLDESIGGYSAFELLPILKATKEAGDMVFCLLFDPNQSRPGTATSERSARFTMFAAWVSGIDLCLSKPVSPDEFQRLVARVREQSEKSNG